jgi:hypothetical protein
MEQKSLVKTWKRRASVALFLVSLFCLTTSLSAQDVDPRLRGEWTLESVEFKIGNNTQRLQIEALLNNPAIKTLVGSFIDDRYFSILFYENEIGLDLKNPTNNFDRPLKGTYSAANDKLTLSLYDQTPRTFNYSVNGENLSIIHVQGSSQLSLIFKLTFRY